MEHMENGTVTISTEYFVELVRCKTQREILMNITQDSKFSVDRETISSILDFVLEQHEKENE